MKAPGTLASTSPDKNPGPAASVAKLAIDPAGGRGELRALGGGKHDEWNQHLTPQLAGALPEARGSITPATVEGLGPRPRLERRAQEIRPRPGLACALEPCRRYGAKPAHRF
jgi:hypothetical protein